MNRCPKNFKTLLRTVNSRAVYRLVNFTPSDQKGFADKSLLETYSAERLPVISEMLEVTTSLLNKTITSGDVAIGQSPILFMLGISCRFSTRICDFS
ncbi:hypothetical protein EV702DRAFT_590304 [Suillus placidus]|uniref:Uncharacterized protein n=1 Tax=Suillus placidus TaxID=48579 RepID=A0A9P7D7L6_9AGAM|nr:hypothetical protein EV702DRAFT_590304 [Suillus placidus]